MNASNAYDTAMIEFRAASRAFTVIREAYRARTIGDAEFLAARREFAKAQAAMDVAEAADVAFLAS